MSIRYYRERAGITQAQLAAQVDVDQSAVCHWEHDRTKPSAKYQRKLAAFFGVTPAELMADEPDK